LIELLVVIAIIALLAAILFPVFGRARENARRSSCQSNLKQMALGVTQYLQDFDERFPLYAGAASGVVSTPYGWGDAIQPYLKSEQIFQCPSELKPPPTTVPLAQQDGYTDYVYNAALSTNPMTASRDSVSSSLLANTSYTVMFLDGSEPGGATDYQKGNARMASRGSGGSANLATDANIRCNHFDGTDVAFADGHVKWYQGDTPTRSIKIWNANTPFATSGQNPTFHPYDTTGTFPAPL